jgi:uncharacterized protein (TIGR04255 family)
MGQYPYPPITEAAIDIRFEQILSDDEQSKISKKLAPFYSLEKVEINRGVQVNINPDGPKVTQQEQKIIRRSNNDQNEIFLAAGQSIIVSQLAVYPGWDAFIRRFSRDYAVFKKITGYRKVARIGLRYINRIDVPVSSGVAKYENYLNLHIALPSVLDPVLTFSFQVKKIFKEIGCEVVINSASIPSPLPNCVAFVIDIDVGKHINVPQLDNDIAAFLEQARHLKNEIFEGSVTDSARKLFYDEQRLR